MEYRSLGRTGVMVSPLCLGAMNRPSTEEAGVYRDHRPRLEAGIKLHRHGQRVQLRREEYQGRRCQRNGQRERVVLATKVHGSMGDGPNEQGTSTTSSRL